MPITNDDTLWVPHRLIHTVIKPPEEVDNLVIISIDPEQIGAILEKYSETYPLQHTIEEIRNGEIPNAWLLSGGTLIMDKNHRIVIGQRDDKAADPWAFTNIGAGRCDRKLEEHCKEEMATEFILCVKKKNIWYQVNFGEYTRNIAELLNRPNINKEIKEKIKKLLEDLSEGFIPDYKLKSCKLQNKISQLKKVIVKWGERKIEKLRGFVWIDRDNFTIEFRLLKQFDLSEFDDIDILFGEGTGIAEWREIEDIKKTSNLTPFLRYFVNNVTISQ